LGSLSSFVGQQAKGTWRLEVSDTGAYDEGNLYGWGLRINYTQETCPVRTTSADQYSDAATATAILEAAQAQPQATAVACMVSFSDAVEGSTFYSPIRCLACAGVLDGYSDGTFRPQAHITRGQLAKIVANAASLSDEVGGQTFSDVPADSPFYVFIERMAARGIIGGFGDGTFQPEQNATRGQIAKIVANSAGYNEDLQQQAPRFTDVPQDSPFYPYIERLASRRVVGGYGDGTFRPNDKATRGQVAQIVANSFITKCAGGARP
jgi:hypothetical protein